MNISTPVTKKTIFSNRIKQGFTLVELLVVIAIIAILAGISLPVVSRALHNANRAKAATEVKGLEAALLAFFNEYQRWPLDNGQPDRRYGMANDNFDLINALRAMGEGQNAGHVLNPRRLVFLEVNENSLDPQGNYMDPWNRPYVVAVDTNFDGNVNTQQSPWGLLERRTVAVWSWGRADMEEIVDDAITSWQR